MPNDAERMRQIVWLVEHGYGRQVLMSHDVCFKIRLARYGGTGSAPIPRRIVPRLRQRGLSEPDVRALVVENPALGSDVRLASELQRCHARAGAHRCTSGSSTPTSRGRSAGVRPLLVALGAVVRMRRGLCGGPRLALPQSAADD